MSQQPLPTLEQLIELLQGALSGNNEKIQFSTKQLKKYIKCIESVGTLAYILANHNEPNIRHLSGVLLKKNIIVNFEKLNQQAQNELKQILLQQFFKETVKPIRTSIGSLIGTIAVLQLPLGKWNELYQIIQSSTDKGKLEDERIKGLRLLGLVLDYSGDSLKQFYGQFAFFFKDSIQDPSNTIRIEVVKCLIKLFDNIGYMEQEHIQVYKEFIPPILNILDVCITNQDEETIGFCFEAFSNLADSKLTILDTHLSQIVDYMCSERVLMNNKISKQHKITVLDFIHVTADLHRTIYTKNVQLLKKLVQTVAIIVSQPFKKHEQEDDDDEEETIQDVALWLILDLTITIPKKKIYSILLETVQLMIESNDPNQMNSGFLILAQMCEGCNEQLQRNLENPIMNVFIKKGLNHSAPEVRGACIKALSYLTEYLATDIVQYHEIILPAIANSLNDLNIKVAEKAMIAIDLFCNNMEEELVNYLPILVPKLVQVPFIQQATQLMKQASMAAIASCISSTEEQCIPFLQQMSQAIIPFIMAKDTPENIAIKAEAIAALGKVSIICYKSNREIYNQMVVPCLETIYQQLVNIKDYKLREGGFSFFYSLATALENDFAPYFDLLIEFTMTQAASEEGVSRVQDKKEGEFSLDTDSEDEDEEGLENEDDAGLQVKTTFLDEKAAAIHAMGEFANSCPLKFANYFEKAFNILEQCYNYFDDNVRIQVVICYKNLAVGMIKCSNNGVLPQFKVGLPCTQRFQPKIEEFIGIEIWQKYLNYLKEDNKSDIVVAVLQSIEDLLKKLGPAFIDHNLDDFTNVVLQLLENKCVCQKYDDDAEEDEDDETVGIIFEEITDVIPRCAKILQEGFDISFQKLFPSLMGYIQENKDINDHIQIIGCFAQCIKKSKSLIPIICNNLIPIMLKYVERNDDDLNRNITFCIGLLVEHGFNYVSNNLGNFMLALKYVFEKSIKLETKDNAAAALCRIIQICPNQVPIENALQGILSIAPLKGDNTEEVTIIQTIMFLAQGYGELIQQNIQKVITILIDGLANIQKYKIKNNELIGNIVLFLKNLANNQQYRQQIENVVFSLGEKEKQTLINYLK